MIQEIITRRCQCCDSVSIVKNGHNAQGQQQCWRKDCNKRAVLHRSEKKKEEVIGACHERPGMRGISRMLGVSRQTLASWLKKKALKIQLQKKRCFQLRRMMSWIWMKCVRLS